MFKKILIPIDGSDAAQKAVTVAKTIAERHGSKEVIFLHCFPMTQALSRGYASGLINMDVPSPEKFEIFINAEEIFNNTGIKINTRLERGYAASNIVEAAKEEQVDLIVIGSRGLSGLKSFFLGSVSKEVVNDAPCAVLVVK